MFDWRLVRAAYIKHEFATFQKFAADDVLTDC